MDLSKILEGYGMNLFESDCCRDIYGICHDELCIDFHLTIEAKILIILVCLIVLLVGLLILKKAGKSKEGCPYHRGY